VGFTCGRACSKIYPLQPFSRTFCVEKETYGGNPVDKSEILLMIISPFHPDPPFPKGREGVLSSLEPAMQKLSLYKKAKFFPSFHRGGGGRGEWENC